MKLLYGMLLHLALPWVFARLFIKARLAPGYRQRIAERFGRADNTTPGAIWFHTVSAGETNAAAPIIRAVRERLPGERFLVTTMTPTGSARVRALLGDDVDHCYAPYDYPWAVARFLRRVRPKALVLMETELWPNLIHQTRDSGAAVYLVNARLAERSYRRYRRLPAFTRAMVRRLSRVVCQYEDTAARFRALGATAVEVGGSVKFDAQAPVGVGGDALGLGDRPVWIAGSTHPGEEDILLAAHRRLLARHPTLALILVPRHPERAAEVSRLAVDHGLSSGKLSVGAHAEQVLIGDVMGTLAGLYAVADVAFVGGSLDRTGGHNPIEAAVQGVPILMGPARFKIEEICAKFAAAGCFHAVGDAADIEREVSALLNDPERRAREGRRAQAVVERNRGAKALLVDKLSAWLSAR